MLRTDHSLSTTELWCRLRWWRRMTATGFANKDLRIARTHTHLAQAGLHPRQTWLIFYTNSYRRERIESSVQRQTFSSFPRVLQEARTEQLRKRIDILSQIYGSDDDKRIILKNLLLLDFAHRLYRVQKKIFSIIFLVCKCGRIILKFKFFLGDLRV